MPHTPRTARIERYRAANRQWAWRLRARNGQIILTPAETFKAKASVARSVRTVFATMTVLPAPFVLIDVQE